MSYVFVDQKLFPVELLGFVDPTDHYSYDGILTEQGEVRKYDSFEELVKHIEQRREAMRYPKLENLRLQIQHYLYMIGDAHPSYFTELENTPWGSEIPRTVQGDIVAGAQIAYELSREAITGFFKAGSSGWVSQGVAEERAKACVNCPKNLDLKKSPFQRWNNRIASLFTMRRTTTQDEKLFECGVCGCPNAEKVHYSAAIIKKVTPKKFTAESFPEAFIGTEDRERHQCWVRKILEEK